MRLIGRRDFLASMGLGPGAYLLGAIFRNNLLPQAMGARAVQKHFFLFTADCGFIENQFTCNARSETDFDLAPCLEPLAPYKKDLLIASKFFNPIDIQQHGNGYAFLSAMPSPNSGEGFTTPGGPTIDRFVGQKIGGNDPFPAVALNHAGQPGQGFSPAADGLRQGVHTLRGPVEAYETLFAPQSAAQKGKDKLVVDSIAADITKMNARLAGPEKAKLDQYMTSLRTVEKQLSALQDSSCLAKVQKPAAALGTGVSGKNGSNGWMVMRPEEVDALVSVSFNAHLCGLTHVTHTSIFGSDHSYAFLAAPGETTDPEAWAFHIMHHNFDDTKITRVNRYLFSTFAQWISLLSKTPDPSGSGTMLDNSLLAYINDSGGIHHLGQEKYAAVMAGRAGGAIKTGRYLAYGERDHCVSDLYCSWANAMDAKTDKFGQPNLCKGPLPGLLS